MHILSPFTQQELPQEEPIVLRQPTHNRMPAAPVANAAPMSDPLREAVEILPDRLYYTALKSHPPQDATSSTSTTRNGGSSKKRLVHFFNIDNELVYWNFFLDFGPLNLGQLYRFCTKLNDKLSSTDPRLATKIICFYSSTAPAKRVNATFLICAWQVLYLDRTPEEAYHGFRTDNASVGRSKPPSNNCSCPPKVAKDALLIASLPGLQQLPPFHDASPCACTYDLTVLDCLRGLAKARVYRYFDFEDFDVEEYEYFEQVENGDLNWIMKDKIIAFAGPQNRRQLSPEGYCTLTPADYIPYFQRKNVGLVVRLNKKCYDEKEFLKAGIDHLEQYYLDGSCPPMKILSKVLDAFERVPSDKAFAVHCKAGLGRTGTCIGAYMMKHYKFTAAEAIGWMRICRPGCVIGPQQHFLQDLEQRMWHEGDVMRMRPQHSRALAVKQGSNGLGTDGRGNIGVDTNEKIQANGTSAVVSKLPFGSLTVDDQQVQLEQHEAIVGRAGQAESLLARRTQAQHQHHSSARVVGQQQQQQVKASSLRR